MNKNKLAALWIIRIIIAAMIAFWMKVIFGFSAENGVQSQSMSDRITTTVIEIIRPDYDNLSSDTKRQFFDSISFVVRKTGHFGEYAILALLIACLLITFKKMRDIKRTNLFTIAIPAVICMIYAFTDEFHQGFVEGRTPKIMDVFIDTTGAIAGVIFFMLIRMIVNGIYRKRRQNELLEG